MTVSVPVQSAGLSEVTALLSVSCLGDFTSAKGQKMTAVGDQIVRASAGTLDYHAQRYFYCSV
ncbi:MAG: hypothetical protein CMD33_06650 [Flavobacteriales bacterium]|jgi:hypothetical protein|nr:hypothetical protein [Flavobacteriales bacterium]